MGKKSSRSAKDNKPITPLDLAQLAIALARDRGTAPQVQFPSALRLIDDARRFMGGDDSLPSEYVSVADDAALLMQFRSGPFGWSGLINMLAGSVRKRAGRNNRVLTSEEVTTFLRRYCKSEAESYIHHLDGNALGIQDARLIAEKWCSHRRVQTRLATEGRKKAAAKKRARAEEYYKNRK